MSPYLKPLILLFFCHASSPAKHCLSFLATASSGVKHLPEYVITTEIDANHLDYVDINEATNLTDAGPSKWYFEQLFQSFPLVLRMILNTLKAKNQNEDVHILQFMAGCERDEKTAEIVTFCHYGYNGEDFMELDLKSFAWIPQHPQAVDLKPQWDSDQAAIKHFENFLTRICPELLKIYLDQGPLKGADLSSVSFLQKTPSSPVTCHATGFFSNRAEMFWRKDGEEIHDNVEHGEVLTNADGTYQMSVDLNISLVSAEDWRRYDCVFKVSGEEPLITRLKETEIRTNWVSPSEVATVAAITAVVGLLLLSILIAGLVIWKKKNNGFRPANTSDSSEETIR